MSTDDEMLFGEMDDMDVVLDFLIDDSFWNMPTFDILNESLRSEIPKEKYYKSVAEQQFDKILDYTVVNCKVKRIQDYYMVKCPYCDAIQYKGYQKPILDCSLQNCIRPGCRKIFIY